jgi:hypothetical protein
MEIVFPYILTPISNSVRVNVIHSDRLCLKYFGESVIFSINSIFRYKYIIDFVKTGIKLPILWPVILSRAIMEILRNQRDFFP